MLSCRLIDQAIILEIFARDWKVFLAAKIMSGCASAFTGAAIVRALLLDFLRQVLTDSDDLSVRNRPAPDPWWIARSVLSNVCNRSIWDRHRTPDHIQRKSLVRSHSQRLTIQTNPMAYRNAFYSQFVVFGIFVAVVLYVPESPGEATISAIRPPVMTW